MENSVLKVQEQEECHLPRAEGQRVCHPRKDSRDWLVQTIQSKGCEGL